MSKLYFFIIRRESKDLARQHSKEICKEIKESYPICKYFGSAFQVSDVATTSPEVRGLVSLVSSCLNQRGIMYRTPIEFSS